MVLPLRRTLHQRRMPVPCSNDRSKSRTLVSRYVEVPLEARSIERKVAAEVMRQRGVARLGAGETRQRHFQHFQCPRSNGGGIIARVDDGVTQPVVSRRPAVQVRSNSRTISPAARLADSSKRGRVTSRRNG